MDRLNTLPAAPVDWQAELKGAQMLIKSGLVPKDVRSAEAALFIIMTGRDMGLSPVQSLRGIKPIQGKIECSADLQLGLYHRAGGKSQWLEISDKVARLKLIAPWSLEPHVSEFTVEDAKRAELLSNPTWRKYPKAMLRSRAITQGLKDIGFLIGAGVYAPGELGGAVTVDASGEVLPADEEKQHIEITSTAGVVEALEDQDRVRLAEVAAGISGKIRQGVTEATEQALRDWHELNTDEKVAVWAMLDKDVRKTLKAADAAMKGGEANQPGTTGPDVPTAAQSQHTEAAPSVTFAKLVSAMQSRKELALLEADADLMQYLPADQQAEAAAEYHRCRTKLLPA